MRNVFLTFSTEIACVGVNFILGVILARTLSPNDRGVMTLVMTFPMIVFGLTNMGLHESIVYFVGRKKPQPSVVFGNIIILISAISLAVVLILIASSRFLLDTFFKGLPREYWLPLVLLIPAGFYQGILLSMLVALEKFPLLNALKFSKALLPFVALIVVLIGLRSGLDGAIAAVIVSSFLTLGFIWIIVTHSDRPSFTFDGKLSKEILRFGFKSYLQIIFESVNYRLDLLLIAWFLVPEQVAYYGLATSLAELGWYLPNSVGSILFARLVNTPLIQIHQVTAQVCRITLALTGILVVPLALACWFFVPMIYGESYWPAVPSLIILLPGIMAAGIHKILNRNFASRYRQQYAIYSSMAAMVLIVSLDVWLIPRWGINGAAFASSLGYSLASVILIVFFIRDSKLSIANILIVQRSDIQSYWGQLKQSFMTITKIGDHL